MSVFPQGYFIISNVFSGKVLDVESGSKESGAKAIIWHRKAEDNNSQLWKYDEGFFINKNSGLVLEVPGYENGGNITPGTGLVQAERRGGREFLNQVWAYNDQYLMPYDPKVCIAVDNDNVDKSGTNAVAATHVHGDEKQQWVFEVVGE